MLPICCALPIPTPEELNQLQRIYDANFPIEFRKPFSHIAARIHSGEYLCLVARSPNEPLEILAFAFLLQLPQSQPVFLEYLAVDEARQGQRIGTELFRFLKSHFEPAGVVWEVEPPSLDPADDSNRRIRFYQELGGELISLSTPYAMPNLESRRGGLPQRLMQLPLPEQPDRGQVAFLIRDIYEVAYPEWTSLRDEILRDLEASFQAR